LAAGVPDISLNSFFIKPDTTPIDFEEGKPRMYLSRNAFNKLEDQNPLIRAKTALGIIFKISYTNLDLLPKPKKVPSAVKEVVQREFRSEFDTNIKSIMLSSIGEKVEDDELEVIERLMYYFIDSDTEQVALGGSLKLILPGQDSFSPELTSQELFHEDMRCYLSVPIMKRFSERVMEEGYAGNTPVSISNETLAGSGRAAEILKQLKLQGDRQESMKRYISSQLAIDEIRDRISKEEKLLEEN